MLTSSWRRGYSSGSWLTSSLLLNILWIHDGGELGLAGLLPFELDESERCSEVAVDDTVDDIFGKLLVVLDVVVERVRVLGGNAYEAAV